MSWDHSCGTTALYEPGYVKTWWVGTVRLYVSGGQGHPAYYDHKLLFQSHLLSTQAEAGESAENWCKENNVTGYFGPIMSGMGGTTPYFVYGADGRKL